MSANGDDSSSQVELQEENFVLKTQVAKLQVALKNALGRQRDGGSTNPGDSYVSKHQLEVVMGELADLRLQVGQLHEENRSLQAQLQHVREAQLASASSSGGTDIWEAGPATSVDVDPGSRDPVSRGDMAFIEREINCLKQKISDTRLKLQAAEPSTPNENEYRAGLMGDRRAAQQRQPLQRKQAVAAGRPGAGPAAHHLGPLGLFGDLLPRNNAVASRPSSATGSAVPSSAPRTRQAAHGQASSKKAGHKQPAKENAANQQHAGANLSSRPKAQRARGLRTE